MGVSPLTGDPRPGSSRTTPPPPEDVRITRVGTDGDGVGALADGTAVYVAGVLPDEWARVRPQAKRGEGWAATVDLLTQPSSARVTPPCRYFGRCGGCALQHWQIEPYADWKAGLLDTALRRAGYAPTLAATVLTPPGARRRMDLAVRRNGSSIVLGLHEARGAAVVDLHSCEVLHPALTALLDPLRLLLRGLALLRREGSVVVNLLDSGPDLLLRADAPASATDRIRLTEFARAHEMPRITLAEGRTLPETACLLRPATTTLSGVLVAPPPGAFLQASAVGETAIVAAVLAGLPDKLPVRARVAELYAGCGTLTFAIANRARIAAFEGDAASQAALQAATNAAGLGGRIDPQRRDLSRQPLSPKELTAFAAVILNPPHAGAAAQMAPLAASKVERVIYVSCNPATLARDAAVLHAGGCKLLAATPIDQFLWSARLESVTVFSR